MLKVQVSVGDSLALERDALVVAVTEDEERFKGVAAKVDKKLNGQLKKLREWKEVKGKLSEVTVVHTLGLMQPRRIALVGLGKRKELDAEKVRRGIGR
ncbi:M17 family peptidase N-terminal domain-containing protein, partial [Fervidibacter sp.]